MNTQPIANHLADAIDKLTALRKDLRANAEPDYESQNKAIRRHLESGKSLTALEALNLYGCFRLGARIWDLRDAGMAIKTTLVTNGKKRFAQYQLEQ
jgi:hypothetical protein